MDKKENKNKEIYREHWYTVTRTCIGRDDQGKAFSTRGHNKSSIGEDWGDVRMPKGRRPDRYS